MTPKLDILPKSAWKPDDRPLLISGPCSAETPAQFRATLNQMSPLRPDAIRAGIWKPRTRPNHFEGVGSEALNWSVEIAAEMGLPLMVEVASGKHVEAALKAGVQMLWIGARTTVNPFLVQEIADAVSGVDVPMLVKNPVNPDLELWIGAIERLNKAGIRKLGAIHRGFSGYEKSIFRNHPNWEIPIELKRLLPELLIICDPSHISGNRLLVPDTAQVALDLDFDGLMIETHYDPENAWSDACQQITPAELIKLMEGLVFRREQTDDLVFNARLEELRAEIDEVDIKLVKLLQQRLDLISALGAVKNDNNITILQPGRWAEILKTRLAYAAELGIDQQFMTRLLHLLHQESINTQVKMFKEVRQQEVKKDH
ncbi:MAG: chorismate mutase [Bacteroidia bacterium]